MNICFLGYCEIRQGEDHGTLSLQKSPRLVLKVGSQEQAAAPEKLIQK